MKMCQIFNSTKLQISSNVTDHHRITSLPYSLVFAVVVLPLTADRHGVAWQIQIVVDIETLIRVFQKIFPFFNFSLVTHFIFVFFLFAGYHKKIFMIFSLPRIKFSRAREQGWFKINQFICVFLRVSFSVDG